MSPHAKGSIWAQILLDAYWGFTAKYGFSYDWKRGTRGNNRILHDVVDSLKIQPCNPSFVDARNAIIQANKVRYAGQDVCIWWKAFTARGLGTQASAGGYEDFTLPTECSGFDYFY